MLVFLVKFGTSLQVKARKRLWTLTLSIRVGTSMQSETGRKRTNCLMSKIRRLTFSNYRKRAIEYGILYHKVDRMQIVVWCSGVSPRIFDAVLLDHYQFISTKNSISPSVSPLLCPCCSIPSMPASAESQTQSSTALRNLRSLEIFRIQFGFSSINVAMDSVEKGFSLCSASTQFPLCRMHAFHWRYHQNQM